MRLGECMLGNERAQLCAWVPNECAAGSCLKRREGNKAGWCGGAAMKFDELPSLPVSLPSCRLRGTTSEARDHSSNIGSLIVVLVTSENSSIACGENTKVWPQSASSRGKINCIDAFLGGLRLVDRYESPVAPLQRVGPGDIVKADQCLHRIRQGFLLLPLQQPGIFGLPLWQSGP